MFIDWLNERLKTGDGYRLIRIPHWFDEFLLALRSGFVIFEILVCLLGAEKRRGGGKGGIKMVIFDMSMYTNHQSSEIGRGNNIFCENAQMKNTWRRFVLLTQIFQLSNHWRCKWKCWYAGMNKMETHRDLTFLINTFHAGEIDTCRLYKGLLTRRFVIKAGDFDWNSPQGHAKCGRNTDKSCKFHNAVFRFLEFEK